MFGHAFVICRLSFFMLVKIIVDVIQFLEFFFINLKHTTLESFLNLSYYIQITILQKTENKSKTSMVKKAQNRAKFRSSVALKKECSCSPLSLLSMYSAAFNKVAIPIFILIIPRLCKRRTRKHSGFTFFLMKFSSLIFEDDQ